MARIIASRETAVVSSEKGNLSNGFTPGMTILNPQQLTPATQVSGSLVQQTPGPSGLFDQCNGYKLTVTVQYQVTRTVNRVRLVPRAPTQ